MDNVTIRRARPADLTAIQELNHQLFLLDVKRDPLLNINWPYDSEGEAYFKRMIAGEIGVCFVAEDKKTIIGYLAGCIRKSNGGWIVRRAEIENMIVQEAYRNRSIGSALIKAFTSWCREREVKTILVGAFAPNSAAIEFYKHNGFHSYEIMLELRLP